MKKIGLIFGVVVIAIFWLQVTGYTMGYQPSRPKPNIPTLKFYKEIEGGIKVAVKVYPQKPDFPPTGGAYTDLQQGRWVYSERLGGWIAVFSKDPTPGPGSTYALSEELGGYVQVFPSGPMGGFSLTADEKQRLEAYRERKGQIEKEYKEKIDPINERISEIDEEIETISENIRTYYKIKMEQEIAQVEEGNWEKVGEIREKYEQKIEDEIAKATEDLVKEKEELVQKREELVKERDTKIEQLSEELGIKEGWAELAYASVDGPIPSGTKIHYVYVKRDGVWIRIELERVSSEIPHLLEPEPKPFKLPPDSIEKIKEYLEEHPLEDVGKLEPIEEKPEKIEEIILDSKPALGVDTSVTDEIEFKNGLGDRSKTYDFNESNLGSSFGGFGR